MDAAEDVLSVKAIWLVLKEVGQIGQNRCASERFSQSDLLQIKYERLKGLERAASYGDEFTMYDLPS